jgi:hypothetical protein
MSSFPLVSESSTSKGMSSNQYKEKVCDQDLLLFVLHLFELLEKKNIEKSFLKQVLTDAIGFTDKTSDLERLLHSILLISDQMTPQLTKEVLDSNSLMGKANCLDEYCMTIRHLALELPSTVWPDFFRMIRKIQEPQKEKYRQLLSAVRHSLSYFSQPESFQGIFRALAQAPEFSEAFSYGQLDSKRWLIEEATSCWGKNWGAVFVLAGWIGVLPRMICDAQIQTTKIRSFDVDENANKISEALNQLEVQKDWQYKSSASDVTKLQYPTTYKVRRKDGTDCELFDQPDVVINTSCEHIADISSWWSQIPHGTKVILQSNDGFQIPEHVACFKTLDDFEKAMGLSKVDYRGEKALPEFNRFMLIGQK